MQKTKSQQRVTWSDIQNYGAECNKKYGFDRKELERQVRSHLDGASAAERREVYETFYGKK